MNKIFLLLASLGLYATITFAQSPARRPWALKVDLAGYASQTLAIEGEFMLARRLSVLGQVGHVSGGYFYGLLESHGFQARIGAKCYLGLARAAKMGGLAIRCELAGRYWHSQEYQQNFNKTEAVGIAALSYTLHPVDRILVEAYLGFGRSRGRVAIGEGTSLFQEFKAPNSPWVPLGKYDYEVDGDLRGYRWGAWQCAFGLLLGFRI